MNSYTQRGGAARRRFCVICKKPEGGGGRKSTPPGCARVKLLILPKDNVLIRSSHSDEDNLKTCRMFDYSV